MITQTQTVNKASWFKLFKFILIKISHSFITMLLLIISLFLSLLVVFLFSLKIEVDTFFINLQYFIIIIYSVFLFIFVLMNAIKIFGIQFEDSSFLLLLTKPYSRKVIFLIQYLGLFFIGLVFISLNILVLLVGGGIMGTIFKVPFLNFYIITILKLFGFLCLFMILVTVGTVTLLAFSPSQTVFLVFIIFCSMFLLGGLPYSMIKLNTDPIQLQLKDGVSSYTVKKIKEAILFDQYFQKGLIKYPHLTTAITNFYKGLSDSELEDIRVSNVLNKRIDFYRDSLGLIKPNEIVKTASGKIDYWKNETSYSNKNATIQLTFNSYFIEEDQLKIDASSNLVKQELLQEIIDYNEQFDINKYMALQQSKAPWLLTYDLDSNKTYVEINTSKSSLTVGVINNIFLSTRDYVFDSSLRIALHMIIFFITLFIIF